MTERITVAVYDLACVRLLHAAHLEAPAELLADARRRRELCVSVAAVIARLLCRRDVRGAIVLGWVSSEDLEDAGPQVAAMQANDETWLN